MSNLLDTYKTFTKWRFLVDKIFSKQYKKIIKEGIFEKERSY